MRKIQNIAFLLLATLFASCINDNIEPSFCRDAELAISVSTSSAGTRVQGDNDDMPTAESIVKDLQYFLYVKGSGEDAAPIYAGTITDITDNDDIDNDSPRPDIPADEDDNFSKTVQIPASALNALFPGGATECEIYIIANYLDNTMDAEHFDGIDLTKDLANATRKKLKAIELNTTFYKLVGDVEMTPTSFVMDSEGTDIVSRGTGNNINTLTSGTIYLTRAAAKVMIEVNVQNAIDVSGNTWEPITQITDPTARKMFISFYNGVTTGVIDDGTDVAGSNAVPTITDAGAYYKVENVQLQSGKIATDGATGDTSAVTRADESTSWVSAVDFYSYANSWTAGDEEHEPYFEISIPWRKKAAGQDDSANWVTYNYTVPIAMNNNRFDRNKLYLIRLNVGALGDLSTLESYEYSYIVLNWDEVTVNATLTRPKYFVVDEEYVEVYNEPSYSVDFTASDIVSAEILSIIKPDYSSDTAVENNYIYGSANNTEGVSSFSPSSGNTSPFTVSVDNSTDDGDSKSITLTHTLNNDMDSNGFDYVPYTVVVRATMTITDSAGNTSTMVKDITFKQYPAMYIKADKNTGGNIVNDNQTSNDDKGYVFVYNNQLYSGSAWSVVRSCQDGGNKNPNMYVITTSVLASNSSYILADPRSRTAQTGSALGIGNSYNGKVLTYYYASSTDNMNYLSPKFRIASSFGKCGSAISLSDARKRCAAYQEQGYPAGRWRVPTVAEMKYIAKLSAEGFIPHLFTGGRSYWSASGSITYDTNGNINNPTSITGSAFVRCVYDEWYWGSEPIADKTKFTWGDEKIW
ncbi:MAG: DUF1566 domain-containing protein [Rikenellaceae bacterium]|nr:DUF1566 domain-containing protein [Rikenellaceae bacterium]